MVQVETRWDDVEQETQYPCIMKSISGTVVLFCAPGKGTFIQDRDNAVGLEVGDYKDNWDMNVFSPFNDIISMKNV